MSASFFSRCMLYESTDITITMNFVEWLKGDGKFVLIVMAILAIIGIITYYAFETRHDKHQS